MNTEVSKTRTQRFLLSKLVHIMLVQLPPLIPLNVGIPQF